MKLLKRDIDAKDGAGSVRLIAEEAEDMWHTYHIIGVGDRVRTSTLRKVKRRGTGPEASFSHGQRAFAGGPRGENWVHDVGENKANINN